tara:strand:- start:399 stop:569 length:171 start_codon:yes stop_codon:yes gene_type:complete
LNTLWLLVGHLVDKIITMLLVAAAQVGTEVLLLGSRLAAEQVLRLLSLPLLQLTEL